MSRASAASSAVEATRAIAVGTPASAMTSLAKALDASSWAAALLGPKTGMPAARTASDTPAARGASGPTTTRSTVSLAASAATASGSFASIAYVGTSALMPALPGAAWTSETFGSASKDRTMACSRPPGPMTSTFTVSKGTLCTPQAPKPCRPPDMPNRRGAGWPGWRAIPRDMSTPNPGHWAQCHHVRARGPRLDMSRGPSEHARAHLPDLDMSVRAGNIPGPGPESWTCPEPRTPPPRSPPRRQTIRGRRGCECHV